VDEGVAVLRRWLARAVGNGVELKNKAGVDRMGRRHARFLISLTGIAHLPGRRDCAGHGAGQVGHGLGWPWRHGP